MVLDKILLDCFARIEEVAAAVVYLASPAAGDDHRHQPPGRRRLGREADRAQTSQTAGKRLYLRRPGPRCTRTHLVPSQETSSCSPA